MCDVERSMTLRSNPDFRTLAAAAVHVLTGMGAVFGLLALLSASEEHWTGAFAWLGAALAVDGADGPLARKLKVKQMLPRFSGEDLDHVVDYLNYVAVPAFILARSAIAPEDLRLPLAGAVMLFSLYHFADTTSKTADGYFVGFPAIWNIAIFYCFVLEPPKHLAALLIALCCVLTLVPLYWIHPLRVKRLRPVTFVVLLAWGVAAVANVMHGFPGSAAEKSVFVIAALYMIAIGLTAGAGGSHRLNPTR
jgi:phosphatidylcholine synthase